MGPDWDGQMVGDRHIADGVVARVIGVRAVLVPRSTYVEPPLTRRNAAAAARIVDGLAHVRSPSTVTP